MQLKDGVVISDDDAQWLKNCVCHDFLPIYKSRNEGRFFLSTGRHSGKITSLISFIAADEKAASADADFYNCSIPNISFMNMIKRIEMAYTTYATAWQKKNKNKDLITELNSKPRINHYIRMLAVLLKTLSQTYGNPDPRFVELNTTEMKKHNKKEIGLGPIYTFKKPPYVETSELKRDSTRLKRKTFCGFDIES